MFRESVTSHTKPRLILSDSSGSSALPPAVTEIGFVGDNVPC